MARGTILTPAMKKDMLVLSRTGTDRATLAKQFHCSLGTVGNVVGKTSAKAKTKTGTTAKTTKLIPLAAIHWIKGQPYVDVTTFGKF